MNLPVPHFKGLISAKVDQEGQGRDRTFTICLTLLKKAILHHTEAAVPSQLATTVPMLLSFCIYLSGCVNEFQPSPSLVKILKSNLAACGETPSLGSALTPISCRHT